MLNRILGRSKAKDLTTEEIQEVAGAGCWNLPSDTLYYDYYSNTYESMMDTDFYCDN